MRKNFIFRFMLLSTSLTFLLISLSLIELAKYPVKSYELSIYYSTPVIFWISVILGLINGFLLTYFGITGKIKGAHILGIFEILFVNSLVLILHALRNYIVCMLRGDAASYVGMIKDVSIYGSIGSDFYPLTSLVGSQLHQISGIPEFTLTKYIPAIFYIFSVLSIYCLSKSLISDKKYMIFAVIAATPLFFAWISTGAYYMLLSVFTLPLFFYVLNNLEDWRFRVLAIIFCFIYPIFHPFTAVVILFYIVSSYLIQRYSFNHIKKYPISATLLVLSSMSVVFWFINCDAVVIALIKIIENLLGMLEATSAADQAIYSVEKLGLASTFQVLFSLIFDEMTFYFLAGIAIYFIIFKGDSLEKKKFAPIIACFISGSLLILFLFGFTFAHRPDRLINLNFNIMLAPVLIAYVIYLNHKNQLKTVFLISLILFATVSTYFSLYQSPLTMRANDYMTPSEYHGADWLIINKNPLIKTADLANPVYRYADFIYGVRFRESRNDLKREFIFPDHFGFGSDSDDQFPADEDKYLVLSLYDEEAYTNVWKNAQRFDIEDFKRIDECKNTLKLFENGGFKTYLIRA